jgi:hypothetical protein
MRGHTEIHSDIHARRSACPTTVSLSAGRAGWFGGLSGGAEEANKHNFVKAPKPLAQFCATCFKSIPTWPAFIWDPMLGLIIQYQPHEADSSS